MTRWRAVLVAVAAAIIFMTIVLGPYFAAHAATNGAIKSAEAAQTTKSSQQAIKNLASTEAGVQSLIKNLSGVAAAIQSLVKYVASVQNGPQAKATRESTGWIISEFQAICEAVPGCTSMPLPKGL